MSAAVAMWISRSPILLMQFYLSLGQAHIDRRDVGVALERIRGRQLVGPTRAGGGDVAVLQEAGNIDRQRDRFDERVALILLCEMRRLDLAMASEERDVELAAAGIVDDGNPIESRRR